MKTRFWLGALLIVLIAECVHVDAQEVGAKFTVNGIGGAGGMYTPSMSPFDKDFMLVSCDMGGTYRSVDGGRSWAMIHWRQINSTRPCRPAFIDADTVLWTTGPDLRISRDKGVTWMPVVEVARAWGNDGITNIVVDKDLFLIGTGKAVYRSADAGKTWEKVRDGRTYGIVRLDKKAWCAVDNAVYVSEDDGKTWTKLDITVKPDEVVRGLAGGMDADGGTVLFGAIFKFGIIRSTDGGLTWKKVDEFQDRNDILMASNQTKIAYASPSGHAGARQVWRTLDGGDTWSQCFFMTGDGANVERSWVQTQLSWGFYITGLGLGICPSDANVVLVSTQGDFYISRNRGDDWSQCMNVPVGVRPGDPGYRYKCNGLEVTSSWEYLFDPNDESRRYIAYTDIGFCRSVDKDDTWIWSAKGCPWSNTFYDVVFDPEKKGVMYAATSNRHDIPQWGHVTKNAPGHAGGVCITEDGGLTWKVLGTGLPKLPCTSIAIDPLKSKPGALVFYTTLYEGGVYKSVDNGKTWEKKSAGLGHEGNLHCQWIRVHPRNGSVYCNITAMRDGSKFPVKGGLWMSTDGGDSWTELTASLNLKWTNGFALHPDDPNTIYITAATIPGSREGGVYKTTDGGRAWDRIMTDDDFAKSGGSGFVHAMWAGLHPDNPDMVYVSTETHGVWFSEDAGKTFKRFESLPFVSCSRVSFNPKDRTEMYISTHGGGVWKGPHKP